MAYLRSILAFAFLVATFSAVRAFVVVPNRSNSPVTELGMTVLTYKGKKKNFPAGSPLSKACAALGVPVKYSCKKGDCATCQVNVGGRFARACTGKVPPEPKLKSLQEKGIEIK